MAAGMVLATPAVQAQGRNHAFVSFDDGLYVYRNPQVMAGLTSRGAAWAFAEMHASNRHPLTAAVVSLPTPVFVVSGTTVMCDVMMLAFYVWSVFPWIRGTRGDGVAHIAAASVLVALGSLTKYFAISLIPLLLVCAMTARHGKRRHALFLLVPVAILSLHHWATHALYGRGLLLDAASFATAARPDSDNVTTTLFGPSFAGGCLASSLFYAPLLWRGRYLLPAAILVAGIAGAFPHVRVPAVSHDLTWAFGLQFVLFVAAGAHALLLAAHDFWRRRDGGKTRASGPRRRSPPRRTRSPRPAPRGARAWHT